jgi:hypothetical protein
MIDEKAVFHAAGNAPPATWRVDQATAAAGESQGGDSITASRRRGRLHQREPLFNPKPD